MKYLIYYHKGFERHNLFSRYVVWKINWQGHANPMGQNPWCTNWQELTTWGKVILMLFDRNWPIPCIRVLEKLVVTNVVKDLLPFYGTRNFGIMFTKTHTDSSLELHGLSPHPYYSFKIQFSGILPSMPEPSKWSFLSVFDTIFIHFLCPPHHVPFAQPILFIFIGLS